MNVSDVEFAHVSALKAPRRVEYFVKNVADHEELWGLRSDAGWLLLGDDEGHDLFPAWPAERYAAAYAAEQHAAEKPERISLEDWLDEWLPRFADDAVQVAVFPLPSGQGVPLEPAKLRAFLDEELAKY
jgi:hypothetical protein